MVRCRPTMLRQNHPGNGPVRRVLFSSGLPQRLMQDRTRQFLLVPRSIKQAQRASLICQRLLTRASVLHRSWTSARMKCSCLRRPHAQPTSMAAAAWTPRIFRRCSDPGALAVQVTSMATALLMPQISRRSLVHGDLARNVSSRFGGTLYTSRPVCDCSSIG